MDQWFKSSVRSGGSCLYFPILRKPGRRATSSRPASKFKKENKMGGGYKHSQQQNVCLASARARITKKVCCKNIPKPS
jgi:hypothetical protein